MTAPLCTRCGREPAVQGSELGVRCLWPEPFTSRAAELAAEECAKCGTVGPVDVACMGCQVSPGDHLNSEQRRDLESTIEVPDDHVACPGPGCDCRSCTVRFHEDAIRRLAMPIEPFTRDPRGQEDAGAIGRVEPPCCARVGDGWCSLPDGHAGAHVAPEHRPLPPNLLDRGRRG